MLLAVQGAGGLLGSQLVIHYRLEECVTATVQRQAANLENKSVAELPLYTAASLTGIHEW